MRDLIVLKLILNRLRKNKTILAMLKGAIAIFSIVVTHYAGFLSGFPIVMISASAVDMFPTFSTLFLFYLTFCYSVSRVAGFVISQGMAGSSILSSVFYYRRPRIPRLRAYIKQYKSRVTEESFLYYGMTLSIFLLLFYITYVHPKELRLSPYFLIATVFILIAALLKSDILVLKPKAIIKRIKNKLRLKYRDNLFSAYVSLGFGIVLCAAFYAGDLRRDRLMQENATAYKSSMLEGNVKILMSNSRSVVGVEEGEEMVTWIYASKDAVQRFNYRKRN